MISIKKKGISLALIVIFLVSGCAEGGERQIANYTIDQSATIFLGELDKRVDNKEKKEITDIVKKWKSYYDRRMIFGIGVPWQLEIDAMEKLNVKLDEYTVKYLLDGNYEGEEEATQYNNYVIENLKKVISIQDYKKLYELCKKYETDMEITNDEIQAITDNIIDILKKYPKINTDEILDYLLSGSENILAIYDIGSGVVEYENIPYVTLAKSNKSVTEEYPKIWNNVESIIPKYMFVNFDKLIISTDGEMNNLAYVIANNSMGSRWNISIDPVDVVEENLFYETIIHEYFHYMTLNNTQVSYFKQPNIYSYSEQDMVTERDSYLNQFNQKFWGILSQESPFAEDLYLFYLRHKNDFVDEYAATSASEDICESFAFFVLRDKPLEDTLANKKLLFFYGYPELVEFRNQIRLNIENIRLDAKIAS
ncbi:MAG: hypothetical protein WBH44_05330 [Proteocatella sp.]